MKKVLVVVLCLVVVVSTLCLSASAFGADTIDYIGENPLGYKVSYGGSSPTGDIYGVDYFYSTPYPLNYSSYAYSSGYFNYEYESISDFSSYIVNSTCNEDVHIDYLNIEFLPIYYYYHNGVSNASLIADYLTELSFNIDNIRSNSIYRVSCDVYSPSMTGTGSTAIIANNYFDTSYVVNVGELVHNFVVQRFDVYNNDVPLMVVINLQVFDIDLQDGDSYFVGEYFDDEYVGVYDEYAQSLKAYSYYNGYGEGYDDGDLDGYDAGYNDGYDAGDIDGYNNGYNDGYDAGDTDGYTNGYNVGYNAGQSSQLDASGIGDFLSSSIGGFLDADIFGSISIGDIMLTVIGIVLTLMFLKFFAGG